ncbi:4-(cytidine 5'-diphospho)-2-C-methyl-D-erythritol kinase [Lentisphaerota bacterium WC36G]|nr:4-(cytidine 5'-diphospho)-2-C-methyl-D-erythritol kinase [Lentisphaerae bacterium WC36]
MASHSNKNTNNISEAAKIKYSKEIIELPLTENSESMQVVSHLRLTTPAKINLYLRVPEKLPNNYHIVQTIFAPIENLFDIIEIKFHNSDESFVNFQCDSDPDLVPNGNDNLCLKAAKLFAERLKLKPSWTIILTKNIPVAAGMGGGSSDAAAVLRLLNFYYGNKLERMELKKIAVKIGADVPFFLTPEFATAEGIGDIITPLDEVPQKNDHNKINLLIVSPQFPVSAKWAYEHLPISTFSDNNTSECGNMYAKMQEALRNRNSLEIAQLLQNDLEYSVEEKFPILTIIRRELYSVGANGVLMSGSGSTMFAVFCNEEFFQEAQKTLFTILPQHFLITASTM